MQLYYDHDERPMYLKVLRMCHISCFAAAGFLSYSMRDSLILADNLKFYKYMINQTYLPKASDSIVPLKAFVNLFCEYCQSNHPNELIEVIGDSYTCKACGRVVSLELETVDGWFSDGPQASTIRTIARTKVNDRPWAINASVAEH